MSLFALALKIFALIGVSVVRLTATPTAFASWTTNVIALPATLEKIA